MNEKSVSVITPAYNAEKHIGAAIESILKQTFRDFEYIILDDNSTDSTLAVIEQYAATDARIVVVKNERNLGIAGNRNKGVSLATGRYIVWQDADDISVPDRIEKQFRFMEAHPETGLLGGFLQFFNDSGMQSIRKYAATDRELRKKIFLYSPVAQPSAMVRKEALDKAGAYDLRYPPAEDLDMSFRIGMHYEFANLQEPMILYREHSASATATRLKKIELSTLEIRRKYARCGAYPVSVADRLYNFFHYLSVYIIPPAVKIRMFNRWRNVKG
jgi:glycosyltransferase involved in cell wall biosynthesis